MAGNIKLVECPRDAMQGLDVFIPTEQKAEYINSLLKIGFHTIDFGSFVSPRSIPQMRDTAKVLEKLDLDNTNSELLSIVANYRGARDACEFDEIRYLGFPFSISESFQRLNINATIKESLGRIEDINVVHNLCYEYGKDLVVYFSMAFGNPYGDEWDYDLLFKWVEILKGYDVRIIALSDTVGFSDRESINRIFTNLINEFPGIEFGAHFHTTPDKWEEKVDAAYNAGCRRFDGALKGFGGCPLSAYHLVGNMATENLISYFDSKNVELYLNRITLETSMAIAGKVFPAY